MLKPDGTRYSQLEIVQKLDSAARNEIMRSGAPPLLDDLVGWEFAGINCGATPDLLGIRKFKKGFYRGPARVSEGPEPFVQGYNIDVVQDGVDKPHRAKPSEEKPRRYGFYRVHKVVPGSKDSVYPNSLLLDYGLGRNGFSITAILRDYLVQVYPDDPTLLLGHAFLALMGMRFNASHFVLQRLNRHDYAGE